MAIDFPNSPAPNELYVAAGKTWKYDALSYAIGATGPAGGIVFITPSTVGNSTGSYFEFAPAATQVTKAWADGAYLFTEVTGADGTAIGTGYQNTLDIVAQGNTTVSAAGYCNDLTYNGYSDWFLPSRDELAKFASGSSGFYNLYGLGTGSPPHWSSSEAAGFSGTSADCHVVGNSSYSTQGKYNLFQVRPVRSFTPAEAKWIIVDNAANSQNQLYDIMVLMKMETN